MRFFFLPPTPTFCGNEVARFIFHTKRVSLIIFFSYLFFFSVCLSVFVCRATTGERVPLYPKPRFGVSVSQCNKKKICDAQMRTDRNQFGNFYSFLFCAPRPGAPRRLCSVCAFFGSRSLPLGFLFFFQLKKKTSKRSQNRAEE